MVGFVLIILLIAYVIMSIPAYVIGERRGVEDTWVAFVPFIGPTIVVLWSIDATTGAGVTIVGVSSASTPSIAALNSSFMRSRSASPVR